MDANRRYQSITDELTILRETHRFVLSWQSLSTAPFHSFLISLPRDDVAELQAAIDRVLNGDADASELDFTSSDAELRVRAREHSLLLDFKRRGDDAEAQLVLDGEGSERLARSLERIASK